MKDARKVSHIIRIHTIKKTHTLSHKVLVMKSLMGIGTNMSIGTIHNSTKQHQNRILSVAVRVGLLQYQSMKPANAII